MLRSMHHPREGRWVSMTAFDSISIHGQGRLALGIWLLGITSGRIKRPRDRVIESEALMRMEYGFSVYDMDY